MRIIGTQASGIRTPIIRQNDDLVKIVTDAIYDSTIHENVTINDRDIVAVTEAVLARAQGNYATTEHIAKDIKNKFNTKDIGVVFPITSRNRFAVLLEGVAKAVDKVYVLLSYPSDEVGNKMLTEEQMINSGVNPYSDSFNEKEFREVFGNETLHQFTGIDYIEYYKSLSDNIEIIFSNDPTYVLNYTKNVLCANVHKRKTTKKMFDNTDAEIVLTLEDILNKPVDGSGYNPELGLMGSNKSKEGEVKLFPRDCENFVLELQKSLEAKFNKKMETMIYGDGAFKDPQGGIWELADPMVSPAYTDGLSGTPNELKLKYLADNEFSHLKGKELSEALQSSIRTKKSDLMGKASSQGTTPRQISDLLGSLSDLVSGSGDKGTPVVLIKGYFDNFGDD